VRLTRDRDAGSCINILKGLALPFIFVFLSFFPSSIVVVALVPAAVATIFLWGSSTGLAFALKAGAVLGCFFFVCTYDSIKKRKSVVRSNACSKSKFSFTMDRL
jgi:hypothetical protein